MLKTTQKKIKTIGARVPEFEELLPEEEAAIEKGRRAYASGEWASLRKIKHGVERSRYQAGTKKS